MWELCLHSFLYISHCHSDYSVTLMSHMINFLCSISSKRHGVGLFYQHLQLLQHQVGGYAWRYPVISPFSLHFRAGPYTCLRQPAIARVTLLKTQKNFVAFLTVTICLHVSPTLAISNTSSNSNSNSNSHGNSNRHCDR